MKSNFINAFINFALGNKRKVEYKNTLLKKRQDLTKEEIDNIIDIIDTFNNTKKEKIAIYWISNGRLILPEDMGKLDDAVEISNRFGVDLFKFNGPVEAINSVKKGKQNRIIDNSGNPDNYKELKLEYKYDTQLGELKVYFVEDSPDGQMAMRRIMNGLWGKEEKGPWCLLYGDGKGGLYEDAWEYWSKRYNTIPKRAAFLNDDLISFCASENGDTTWWDLNDKDYPIIKLEDVEIEVEKDESLEEFLSSYTYNDSPKMKALIDKYKDSVFSKEKQVFINSILGFDERTKHNKECVYNVSFFRLIDFYGVENIKVSIRSEKGVFYIFRVIEPNGNETRYCPNGEIECFRSNNKEVFFHKNGQMSLSRYIKNGKKYTTGWYQNGNIRTVEVLDFSTMHSDEDVVDVWYENGIKESHRTSYILNEWYKDGSPEVYWEEDGIYLTWNTDGKVKKFCKRCEDWEFISSIKEFNWDDGTCEFYPIDELGYPETQPYEVRKINEDDIKEIKKLNNKYLPILKNNQQPPRGYYDK